jgi:ADP-heptose:LPS heptosyltransferase
VLTAARRRVRYLTNLCVDTIVALSRKATRHSERVLVIRVDAIGDFVLWLDAAKATVKHYRGQGKGVTLVANAAWAAWAEELKVFDEVLFLEKGAFDKNLLYRYRFERRVRALGCSIAVQPTYTREWLFGDALVRTCGATERIGSTGCSSTIPSWQLRISDRWYTRLIPADPSPCMELVRNAEFVRGLGDARFRAKVVDLRGRDLNEVDKSFVAAIPAHRDYYVLFPGAGWEGRQWTLSNFVAVAEWLHERTGWHGVICGGQADRGVAETICRQCSAPLLNWVGCTDLPQMVNILSGSQFLLTNETSATHIAAAVGIPTVCVLGGGHYGRFMPYKVEERDDRSLPIAVVHPMPCFDCNWQCIYERPSGGPVPCIEQITVAEVSHAISQLLGLLV